MDDTHAIVCYRDNGNSGYGTAVCLTLNTGDNSIDVGTPAIFESGSSLYVSVTAMDSTKAIVCYQDNDNSSQGTAVCLTLDTSDDSIDVGTHVVFNAETTTYITVVGMDTTHAIVCYQEANQNKGACKCLTLSGTTISNGTETIFEDGISSYISATSMSSTKAIVCYRDGGDSNKGKSCCLSLSGTTVTAATPVVFESNQSSYISVSSLDSEYAIVCYRDNDSSNGCKACALSLSGTTITTGTSTTYRSTESGWSAVERLSDTQAIVCFYYATGTGNIGETCLITLDTSDDSIDITTPVEFESGYAKYNSVVHLADGDCIVCYQDGGNSNYGTATLITAS
jgi:hypothetical protein